MLVLRCSLPLLVAANARVVCVAIFMFCLELYSAHNMGLLSFIAYFLLSFYIAIVPL